MEKIKFELTHENSVAKIILQNGKGNILDSGMMKDLSEAFVEIKKLKGIKLITFEGSGNHFSFGASVEEHTKENAPSMLKGFSKLFFDLIDLSIPTLAKISGQCLGGGMELAIACNFLFCDATAKFGQPEIVLGVFAPVASLILPFKLNTAVSNDFLLNGRIFSADEVKTSGLVNEVYENKEALEAGYEDWLEKNILPKSASSLRFAVKAANFELNRILLEGLPKLEKLYVDELMESYDANEGINAFLEKRKAVWMN